MAAEEEVVVMPAEEEVVVTVSGGDHAFGLGHQSVYAGAVPGTVNCLIQTIMAEASCIPILEGVTELFELDISWRRCCQRIAAVDAQRQGYASNQITGLKNTEIYHTKN